MRLRIGFWALNLLLIVVFLAIDRVRASLELFDFKSDTSLAKLMSIRKEFDEWKDAHQDAVYSGEMTFREVAEQFWMEHRADYNFLLAQSHALITAGLQRYRVEIELILSDAQAVEDLMDVDTSPLISFLQSNPRVLNIILQNSAYREPMKQYFKTQYMTPLFNRMLGSLISTKWNSRCVCSAFA